MKLLRVITIGCLTILLSVSVASASNWAWEDTYSGGQLVEWKEIRSSFDSWDYLNYTTTTNSLQTSKTITVDSNFNQFGLTASRRLGVYSGNVLLSLDVSALGGFDTSSLVDGVNSFSSATFMFTILVDDVAHKLSKTWSAASGEDTNFDYSDIWNVGLGAGEHTIDVICFLMAFSETEQTALTTASLDSFKVVASVTPTPIPGAVWLLGSGLVGLIGFTPQDKRTVIIPLKRRTGGPKAAGPSSLHSNACWSQFPPAMSQRRPRAKKRA